MMISGEENLPQLTVIGDSARMKNIGGGQNDLKESITNIYSNFLMRVTMFEELVSAGSRLLTGFQQALGYLGRPPIDTTSTVVEHILKDNSTKRLMSYIESGFMKADDVSRSVNKLNTCHLGLQDHVRKGKIVFSELQTLIDDATTIVRNTSEEYEGSSCDVDCFITSKKFEATDYAFMMAIVYSMVKQDYEMQVRIVLSLNVKSSAGELETYSQMWSLRPYVDDEKMHKAWGMV